MKFTVVKTIDAQSELDSLENTYIALVNADIELVENNGIEFTNTKHLRNDIFEIKSGRVRSLFGFYKGQKIIITVIFLKKTQKTPDKYIKLAQKRLQNYIEDLEKGAKDEKRN